MYFAQITGRCGYAASEHYSTQLTVIPNEISSHFYFFLSVIYVLSFAKRNSKRWTQKSEWKSFSSINTEGKNLVYSHRMILSDSV